MTCLYNEIEPFVAQWLRNLADAGHIAPGRVDERSIADLQPGDLAGITQAHFFAGIGGWSYALRLAGWPDDAPVWTGSCPCQPFSSAGKGEGFRDARHLWPEWFRLIRECRPGVVFGEQVASAAGRAWLDAVSTDLEGVGYAVGAADLCAAGVGAPHLRQRLYFVAHATGQQRREESCRELKRSGIQDDGRRGPTRGVADADGRGRSERSESDGYTPRDSADGHPRRNDASGRDPWSDPLWLPCRDGKARPTQPGLFPLADGVPGRVGRLRAYGNAIVPQVAAEFIRAYLDTRGGVAA